MTTFLLSLIFIGVFFQVGRRWERQFGRRQPRHDHTWELIEKSELPSPAEIAGKSPTEMILAIKEANRNSYAPNTQSAVTLARRELVVHMRCMCGAEKVERI